MSTTESQLAREATPAPEFASLTDDALDSLFADNPSDDPDDSPDDEPEAPIAATTAAPKDGAPPTAAKPAADAGGIDLSAFDDPTPDPAAPKTAPDADAYVATVKQYLPNVEAVETVVRSYQNELALDNAVQSKDAKAIFTALGDRAEPILEAIWAVAKDKLVQRYLDEASGTSSVDPAVAQLQAKVDALTSHIEGGIKQNQSQATQAAQAKAFTAVHDAIIKDLDTAKFPNDPFHAVQRKLIVKAAIAEIAQNGQLQAAMNGDYRPVRNVVKALVSEYVAAQKGQTVQVAAARDKVENKLKPVPQGAGAGAVSAETEDAGDMLDRASSFIAKMQRKGR